MSIVAAHGDVVSWFVGVDGDRCIEFSIEKCLEFIDYFLDILVLQLQLFSINRDR